MQGYRHCCSLSPSGGPSSSMKMGRARIASVVQEVELRRTFKLPGVAGSYEASEWWLARPSMLRTVCLGDRGLSRTSFGRLLSILYLGLLQSYLQDKEYWCWYCRSRWYVMWTFTLRSTFQRLNTITLSLCTIIKLDIHARSKPME